MSLNTRQHTIYSVFLVSPNALLTNKFNAEMNG